MTGLLVVEEGPALSIEPSLRKSVDALANPVTASVGIGVALLPLTKLGPMFENKSDGEGSPGDEEDIGAVAAWGGVIAMGEQEGEEESTQVAIAMSIKRNLRLNEIRLVRI